MLAILSIGMLMLINPSTAVNICSNLKDGFYKGSNCTQYFSCHSNIPTSFNCKGEEVYDPILGICEDPEFVDNCAATPPDTETPTDTCELKCPAGNIILRIQDPIDCITVIRCHDPANGAHACPTGTESSDHPIDSNTKLCKLTDPAACSVTGGNPSPQFCVNKTDDTYQNPTDCDSYFTCANNVAQYTKCPSGETYDLNTKGCSNSTGFNCTTCGENFLSLPNEEFPSLWSCCNGEFYHTDVSHCLNCGSEVRVVSDDVIGDRFCHDGKIYDHNVHYLQTCNTTTEIRLQSELDNTECCGSSIFHVSTHKCRVCGPTKKLYTIAEATNYQCCRHDIFDKRVQKCRVCETTEKLYPIAEVGYFQCCGKKFFDSRVNRCKSCGEFDEVYSIADAAKMHCCKDHLYDIEKMVCKHCCAAGESRAFLRGAEADNTLCCGDSFYDRRVTECIQCPGESAFYDHADAIYMDCCGDGIIDTRTEECRRCVNEYASLSKSTAQNFYCCGNTFYDTLQSECKYCSNSSFTVISDNETLEYGCCGGTYYEAGHSMCKLCDGVENLKPKYNSNGDDLKWKCCGNTAIDTNSTCNA